MAGAQPIRAVSLILILILIIFIIVETFGCGGSSGGGSGSSAGQTYGPVSGSAKFYLTVTLTFPNNSGKTGNIKSDCIGAKIPQDLDYYQIKLNNSGTGEVISDTKRINKPEIGDKATVTFWDVPECETMLSVKGYNANNVLIGENYSRIVVSLASVSSNSSNNSGG